MLKSIISIPYGSIKSDPAKEQPSAVVVFQFLMVRLKEQDNLLSEGRYAISIPYGSIKSLKKYRL